MCVCVSMFNHEGPRHGHNSRPACWQVDRIGTGKWMMAASSKASSFAWRCRNKQRRNCWKALLSAGKSIFKPHGFWIWSSESWFWSTYVFYFPVPFSMWICEVFALKSINILLFLFLFFFAMVGFWFLVIFNDTCLWISSTTYLE